MTICVLFMAWWAGEAVGSQSASEAPPERADVAPTPIVAEFVYPETPQQLPSALVVGVPGSEVRHIATGEVSEVVYSAEGPIGSIDVVTAAGSIRVMHGSLQYAHASRIASWAGVKVRSTGAAGRGLIAVKTVGSEPDPSAPQGSPVWYHPVIIGRVDGQLVKEAAWKRSEDLRGCTAKESAGAPRGGLIEVKFGVSPKGAATDVEVKASSVGSAVVEGCVLDVVRRLNLPRPTEGTALVMYTVLLTPA